MANEKTIRTRIQNRHAPESYWVSNNTFVPRAGEIIIYDVDETHSHPRVKIGDGQTTIVNLPFSDATVLGETADTAYRGDRGKTAYDHAFAKGSAYSSGLYKVTTNEQGHVTNATPVVKKDITDLGVPAQDTTYNDATQTTHGLMSANDKKKLDNAKELQSAVSDPTASGTAVEFISGISQNDQGVISPSKKTVRTMGAASANAAGSTGLVPAPAKGDQGKFLNGAGQWQTPTNTKNTAGSTDSSSKLFLIGATSQAASPQTYSHDTAYVGTDGCLYSGGKKVLTDHQDISGKVPTSRKINNKALSADITLTGEDIPVSSTNASSLSQQIDDLGPYNGLDSDSTIAALSAAQGKALKTLLDKLNSYELLLDYTDTYETRRTIYRVGNVIVATLRNLSQSTEIPGGSLGISYVIPEKYRPKFELVQMGTSQSGTNFNFGIGTNGGVNGWIYAPGIPGQMFATITWSVPLSSL